MRASFPTFVAFVLLGMVLFAGTWNGSLLASDGALYAQSAREMLRSGDFLVPTWQHEALFEKGPLHTGLIAVGMAIFGENEFGARFASVAMAFLFSVMVFLFARRLGMDRPAAWVAVLCSVFPQVFFFTTRRPLAEIPSVALGMLGLYVLLFRRRWLWSGVVFGLVLLIKYPIGLLYLAVGLAGVWSMKHPFREWLFALAAAVLVAAPWHVYMGLRFGAAFWDVYMGYHLFGRMSHAIATSAGPWFYIRVLAPRDLVFMGLWLLGVAWAVYRSFRHDRNALFLLMFALITFLPVQVSATRHVHYLVWSIPAFGLLAGYALYQVSPRPSLSIALAVVLALSGMALNIRHMTDPDYGHSSKAFCRLARQAGLAGKLSGTFQLYDPDLTWYCDQAFVIWNHDPVFQRTVGSIPMLRPFVRQLNAAQARKLAGANAILVTVKRFLPDLPAACAEVLSSGMQNEMLHSNLALAGFSAQACRMLNNPVLRRYK